MVCFVHSFQIMYKNYFHKEAYKMKRGKTIQTIDHVKKSTSQGTGGRSRRIKISMAHMNKNKKRSYKKYRGQGR